MPSYKNQLTSAIIQNAFNLQLQTKDQQYVQIQVLYRTLCKMKASNQSSFSKIKENKFDQQIYDQILQESELIRVQDKVLVKMQNFIVNLMRAQIALNQKLKSLHLHSQQIDIRIKEGQSLGISANKLDKRQEQIQQLKKEVYELRVQRQQNELVFIREQELLKLTKQLQYSKSNPYFNIRDVQNKQISKIKSQQIHEIGHKKNSQPQLIQHKQINLTMNIIFWLVLMLLICELIIIVFQKNNYLNILVLVLIMSIFVRQVYSRIIIKFILIINTGSILIELIFIGMNINKIWYRNMQSLSQQMSRNKYINYSLFYSYFIVIMIVILLVKLLLSLLLVIQVCKKESKQMIINGCCFQFNIKSVQSGLSNDCINNALLKSFS